MNQYRPLHHITPKKGWINDPNGFVYFGGKYHLYCQYNPHDVKWGPMHWLHFVSEDLIHFEEVGVSMKPDQPCDHEFGCFSGSGIEKDGKLYFLYTGASDGKQRQCLAISEDGHTFKKYEGNPVLAEKDLPEGYLVADFRDPKIFYKNDKYFVLLACRHKDGYSSILLYSTLDFIHYDFVGVVKNFDNCLKGGMVECPDILFDGEKCALLYSLQNPKQEGEKFQSAFPVAYTIGKLDLSNGKFTPLGEERELDRGFACYATQTLQKDCKSHIVYWESSWGNNYPTSSDGYVGQLSLVKEVRIEDDCLKMSFLPNSSFERILVKVYEEDSSIFLNNIEISISKKEKKITIFRKNMDEAIVDDDNVPIQERHFHLKDVENLIIDYSYDNSCVEMSFQEGEAFVSMLNIKKDAPNKPIIKVEGCSLK